MMDDVSSILLYKNAAQIRIWPSCLGNNIWSQSLCSKVELADSSTILHQQNIFWVLFAGVHLHYLSFNSPISSRLDEGPNCIPNWTVGLHRVALLLTMTENNWLVNKPENEAYHFKREWVLLSMRTKSGRQLKR